METKQLRITKGGDVSIEFLEGDVLERYDALAREALEECRKAITMALRYLSTATWYLPFERRPLSRTLATSGTVLRYDPENVIERYRADANELVRDCLHAVLHCVFHHPFDKRHAEFDTWSLACDISVELCALEMAGTRFPSALDAERNAAIKGLREITPDLTTATLYRILQHGEAGEVLYRAQGLAHEDMKNLVRLFTRDIHDLWAGYPREGGAAGPQGPQVAEVPDLLAEDGEDVPMASMNVGGHADQPESGSPGEQGEQGEQGESAADAADDADQEPAARDATGADGTTALDDDPESPPAPDSAPDSAGDAADQEPATAPPAEQSPEEEDDPSTAAARKDWEQISKQVETELRARQQSLSGDGALLMNLAVSNKKPADYADFLRRFATVAEDIRVNDDEFDYIFYTYGMNRYGNIPLVEPLEYKESERVREFVIALDTSGSTAGDLVKTFVERTYSILRQQTSFGDEINIHLIQCDNAIRSATKVTSLQQLQKYEENFWVRGGGGTDFRPVFEYVQTLLDAGEFEDLRGLIYFTDGFGTFPGRAPDYDVAFVFVSDGLSNVRVPAWAMKVVMTQEEVREV